MIDSGQRSVTALPSHRLSPCIKTFRAPEHLAETCNIPSDSVPGDSIPTLMRDLHFALRQLRKAPGFTATAVLTLGIGIGGVTAVFSVVEAVLLRPLPLRDPAQLMSLHERAEQDKHELRMSAPDVLFFQQESKAFSAIGGFISSSYELTEAGAPFRAQAERVPRQSSPCSESSPRSAAPSPSRKTTPPRPSTGRSETPLPM